ncbi:MAG TPA: transposase [Vicinamibacterales bacterium]|nr:transposase [Vicinamibacterales bacterium]
MAMGRRTDRARTPGLWIATNELPATGGHPFYQRLNQVLDDHAFDAFVEAQCAPFYADKRGRPSLTPGTYFRLLLVGYFEGIDSERGIAWRTADSLALRGFLGLGLDEMPPEHSTISRTRRLIDLETHRAVFTWILQVLATADLVKGKTIGIDATTLEANAALRSIVRRDSGETYQEFLTRLAQASGIETPTRADLARLDRKRPKKGRNSEWRHPHDPDARITKMKDGRTHLAHKAEHAVDLATGAIVGVTVQGADQGDTTTIADTVTAAAEELEAVATATDDHTALIEEVVADKGYHSNQVLVDLAALDLRTYVAEPDRGRRRWRKKAAARDAVYANRRRIRGTRGRALQRRRSEQLERPNAHLYETGGLRRTHLRGHTNILKRLLVHVGGFNLGLLMRTLVGVGTPRGLQGRLAAVVTMIATLARQILDGGRAIGTPLTDRARRFRPHHHFELLPTNVSAEGF